MGHSGAMEFTLENNKFIVKNGDVQSYYFHMNIDGYNVNCGGDRVLLWGHPLKIENDNPQASGFVLLNIIKKSIIKSINFSKGIYEVDFLTNRNAYIGSGLGYTIDIDTGVISNLDTNIDLDDTSVYEKCIEKNKSWSYNRYAK